MSSLHMEMPSLHSIKARQASGAPLLKDYSVIITVFNGEGHLEEKTLLFFPLLCHSSYSHLTQFEHGTCTGFACSFLSPCTQAIFPFYSLVSENLPLAFDPKSNNSNQTSYCLIPDFLWLLTFPTLTLSVSLPQRMQAVTPFSAKCPPVLKCSLR